MDRPTISEKGLKCKPYAILVVVVVAFLGPGFLMPGVRSIYLGDLAFEEAFSVE